MEEVNCTEPPLQNVVGPVLDIVGVAGIGFSVTVIALLADEVQRVIV